MIAVQVVDSQECIGITKWLVSDPNYVCPRCDGKARPIKGRTLTKVDVDGTMFDVGPLSTTWMICCALVEVVTGPLPPDRYVAWGTFRKLLPFLTTRHLSPKVRGKVLHASVRSAMLHGSETWGSAAALPQWLHLIRWICGTKDQDETPSASLLKILGIEDITTVL